MLKFWFVLIAVIFSLRDIISACDDDNYEPVEVLARQNPISSTLAKAYGLPYTNPWDSYYYQTSPRVPEYANPYEGRTPLNRQQTSSFNPLKNFFNKYTAEEVDQPESRFGLNTLANSIINTALFNNRFTSSGTTINRPFANLFNSNRLPISLNPNYASVAVPHFDSCVTTSGDYGICSPNNVCSLFGGRPSGSCLIGGVCCINTVTSCGSSVTLNNTYWQSPTTAPSASSSCAVTVKLDSSLLEQKKAICQVRLDFVSFTIAQPSTTAATAGTCTDTFQVGGATNRVPTICGDNNGQHMYLEVPSSTTDPTDLQLMFNFGTGTAIRSWNIKIAMLPCGVSYLAPSDCLQYFTGSSGRVSSFNWRDTTGLRQLNNQAYNICFRTEIVNSQKATQMCLSVCSVTSGGDAFSITTPLAAASAANSAVGTLDVAVPPNAICLYDFLSISGGGLDSTSNLVADRFCGNTLNPTNLAAGLPTSVSVCTTTRPFRITYQTDGTEAAVAAVVAPPVIAAGADTANTGFCLNYVET